MRARRFPAAVLAGSFAVATNAAAQCPIFLTQSSWSFGSGPGQVSGQPWLAADRLGNVYLGVIEGSPGYLASRDGGFTWDAGNFTITGGADRLVAAAAPDGQLVAAYVRGLDVWARRSLDFGASWSRPAYILSATPSTITHLEEVSIAVEQSGLCAVRAVFNTSPLTHDTFAAASQDFGLNWGAPALIQSDIRAIGTIGHDHFQFLAIDDPFVVVADVDSSQMLVRRSADRGLTWDPAIAANLSPMSPGFAGMGTSGSGHFQAAYFTKSPNKLRVATSEDGGATFSSEEIIGPWADVVGVPHVPQFVKVGDGEIALIGWYADALPGYSVSFSSNHGLPGSWTLPARFATSGNSLLETVRAAPGPAKGMIYAVHEDYRYNNPTDCPGSLGGTCESIYLQQTCDAPRTWNGAELRLDHDSFEEGPHSEDPVMVVDPGGRIHVAWNNAGAGGQFLVYIALDSCPDPVPDPLGNVLKAARSGIDADFRWIHLPLPAREYQLVSLDCDSDLDGKCDQLPLDATLAAQPYRSAPVGAQALLAVGDVRRPSFLVFYRVRATSVCAGIDGPV